jgi:dipeptidase E
MKLYLSSYRIPTPEDVWKLAGQPADRLTTAVIVNAKDYKPADERRKSIDEVIADLQKLGLHTTLIDLGDFPDASRLQRALAACQIIYLCGGNTFVLRSLLRKSGFDDMIQDLLAAGRIYIGESAGAVVAGRTLDGFETMDDPGFLGNLEQVNDGLGLIDAVVIPHIDSEKYQDRMSALIAKYQDKTVFQLRDDQTLVVDGSEHRIVTGVI